MPDPNKPGASVGQNGGPKTDGAPVGTSTDKLKKEVIQSVTPIPMPQGVTKTTPDTTAGAGPRIPNFGMGNKEKGDFNFGDAFKSGAFNGMMGMIGDAATNIGRQFSKVDETAGQQMAKDALTNVAKMFGPIGHVASMAYKITDMIGNVTGTNLDALNKDQAEAAGISGAARFFNNTAGVLTPLAGAFTGDTIDAYNTREAQQLSSAYGDTTSDINTAGTMGGKSYLFGKGKANDFIREQNRKVDLLTDLQTINSRRKNNNYQMDLAQQNQQNLSGISAANRMYMGRTGLKLMSKAEAQMILNMHKIVDADIQRFLNGGVIGVDTNILPEGALHRELNKLDDINEEVGKEVTVKGIPVIVTDEKGNIEQVCEIEREEIIFRKEITTKLEELWKDGSEKAMIEAGKLLAEEIITNTKDNTGQIEDADDGKN